MADNFNIMKFFKGFAFWKGAIAGKLVYYFVIVSIVVAVALGIYHRFTQETFENTYKNTVKATTVTIDQKQILPTKDDVLLIGIKLFGFKIGITYESKPKVTNTVIKKKSEK